VASFFGASSIERLSVEPVIEAQTRCFKELPPTRGLEPVQPGRPVTVERVSYRPDLLPAEIAVFTPGGGHGGSHPPLAHEFVRSNVEERPAAIDAVTAAHWTAAGLCAHASAEREGEPVAIPDFSVA